MSRTNTSEEPKAKTTDQSRKVAKEHLNISASTLFGKVLVDLHEQETIENTPPKQRVKDSIRDVIDYTDYSTTQLTYALTQLFTTYGVERKPVRNAVDTDEVTTWTEIATAFCHAALVNTATITISDSKQNMDIEWSEEKYRGWLKSPWKIDLEVELVHEDRMQTIVEDITTTAEERLTISEDAEDEIDRRIAASTDNAKDAIGGALMYHADGFSHDNPIRQASILTLAENIYGIDGSKSLNRQHLEEYLAQGWRDVLTIPLVWDALGGCVRVYCGRHPEEYPTLNDALNDERTK